MQVKQYFRFFIIRLFGYLYLNKRSKVIFYHDLHDKKKYTSMSTSIRLFRKHIDVILSNGYEIVPKITKKYGQIEICFDDGFLGLYENISILREYNIYIHLFIISSSLNKKNYINKRQLIELNKLPFIKISSHTHTHRLLNTLNDLEMKKELSKSKEILEALLDTKITAVCYPEGVFNQKIIETAFLVGYEKQYSSMPGFYCIKSSKNVINRSLVQFSELKEFKAILKGGDHLLYYWYKFKHYKK